jgi:hypothetical protein
MQYVRRCVSVVIAAAMFVTFIYGMWRFPDAPIHPCQKHGYCGKQGQPRSYKDFAAFQLWQTTLMWMWPSGMLGLYLLQKKSKSDYERVRATYDR